MYEDHDWIDEFAEIGWWILAEWTVQAIGIKLSIILIILLMVPFFLRNP